MKFYVLTIEQVKGEEEGTYNEYANVKKYNDEQSAMVYFYQRCSEVANSLGKTHVYMDIKIVNSLGGITKKDSLGAYVEAE